MKRAEEKLLKQTMKRLFKQIIRENKIEENKRKKLIGEKEEKKRFERDYKHYSIVKFYEEIKRDIYVLDDGCDPDYDMLLSMDKQKAEYHKEMKEKFIKLFDDFIDDLKKIDFK